MNPSPWYFDDECDLVSIAGPDAVTYLQGQLSCDVAAIEVSGSALTMLLDPGGHLVAWGRLWRSASDTFGLELESGFGEPAAQRLHRFLIRTDAKIDLGMAFRRRLRELPALDPNPVDSNPVESNPAASVATIWAGRLPTGLQWATVDWAGAGLDTLADAAWPPIDETRPASTEQFELMRISAGVPKLGTEVVEGMIPAAAGIVDASASFTKGCYVGQELVARVDSRGSNTPERLRRFSSVEVSAPPAANSAVSVDADEVGRVTSAAATLDGRWVGLGYLHRGVQVPTTVHTQTGDADAEPARPDEE